MQLPVTTDLEVFQLHKKFIGVCFNLSTEYFSYEQHAITANLL